MASSVEIKASSVAITAIEWCPPCHVPYFPYSCIFYQHQYLGLHVDQMAEPTPDPVTYVTMINFWVLRYAGEQANCPQTKAPTSKVDQ